MRTRRPPRVTPIVDPSSGQLLAFARASTGNVVQFDRDPSSGQWSAYDLGALYGVPPTVGPVLPAIEPDYSSSPIAFAPANGGDVLQYSRPGTANTPWRALDLSAPFGLGTTTGPIVPWTDPDYSSSLLAMDVAANGDVLTLGRRTSDGSWHRVDLTTAWPQHRQRAA